MQLISQLNEAADIPLEDLRTALKKDKRVSQIFTKDLTLDEIKDLPQFLDTLKHYVLNNRHVIEFVKRRSVFSARVNTWTWKSARLLKSDTLTQDQLTEMQTAILNLLKDVTAEKNSTLSNDAAKQLWSVVNGDKRASLGSYVVRELLSTPSIRPDSPVRLYRGLSFARYDMVEKTGYNGIMEVGQGLQFLRSIREGSRTVDIEWKTPTVWTRDLQQAERDAFGEEGFWDEPVNKTKPIRGDLGFVISMLAQPASIIADTSMMPYYENLTKQVAIINEGKYTCRVVHKYTKDGEVDPTERADSKSPIADMAASLEMFAHVFKPPYSESQVLSIGSSLRMPEAQVDLNQLVQPEATIKIVKLLDTLISYYNEHLSEITPAQMAAATGGKYDTAIDTLKCIRAYLHDDTVAHPTKKGGGTGFRGNYRRHELSGREVWETKAWTSMRIAIKLMRAKHRVTDWQDASAISHLATLSGVPYNKEMNRLGIKNQLPIMEAAVKAFYDIVGEPQPTDWAEAVDRMDALLLIAERNAVVLDKMWYLKHVLDRLKG